VATYGTVGDRFDMLYTGEENCDRRMLSSATNAPATGVMRLSYFTARKTMDVTQIAVYTGTTAAAATPTLCAFGVYVEDQVTRSLTLVGSTTNDTTLFSAASTKYTKSFITPWVKRAGSRYAFASLVVSGAAVPSFASITPQAAAELDLAPRLSGQITGQASIPGSIAAGSIVPSGMFIYSVLS
jgi:hypothetical protein